jgi:excisionase family DNA binding protein
MPTVTQSEAARILGVSRRTVKRRIDAGELPTVDTPDGVHVVLDDDPVPTPAHGHAQADAHPMPTPDKVHDLVNFVPTSGHLGHDLTSRLERAESRIDRLLEVVQEQNRTIQAQTIRLAQIEGRVIDTRAAETSAEPPDPVIEPDIPTPRRDRLRAWYVRWRGGH